MAYTRFTHEYQKNAVNGASPLQLVLMMYDGALKHMEAGKHAIKMQNLELQNASLQKAQRIILELMACLDLEKGGDISKNLLALYTYAVNELVEANVKDDIEGIERAIEVMSQLRGSWDQLHQQFGSKPAAGGQQLAA